MNVKRDVVMIPKVSVLMSVYNGETYLERSIESVLSQTYRNFEFLIINDASTDSTEDILKKVDDHRIKVVANSENVGLTKSLNKGIDIARGQYIARMDADDLSLPYRFEIQVDFLEKHPEYAVLGSSYLMIDQEGRTVSLVKVPVDDSQIREVLLKQNCFGHGSVMMRTEALRQVGGYDERFKCSQDYDLWLRIVETFKVSNIEEALYCWRLSNDSISKMNEWEQKYYASFARFEANQRRKANKIIMESTPKVSVIIPTYNRPDSLAETIQSVVDQTYSRLEIIVINDGGIDVSNTLNPFKTKREVKYIKHDHNKGLPAARNTGIRFASGKYIAYLDDDDIFYPWHLDVLTNFLENSEFKVAFTEACRAYQTKENGKYVITKRDTPYAMDFNEDQILMNNIMPVICVMHDKSCLDEVGLFDESLSSHEDWDLWIRMSRKFKFAHIKELTCEFRCRNDGTNMTEGREKDFLKTMEIIYEKYNQYTKDKPFILKEQKKNLLNLWGDIYLCRVSETKKEEIDISETMKQKAKQDYKKLQSTFKKTKKEFILMIKKFLDHYPYYAPAHKELGIIYFQQGKTCEGLTHIIQALSSNPNDAEAKKIFVRMCSRLGFFDQALNAFCDILATYSGNLGSLLTQGKLLFYIGRKKEALRIFIKVIAKELKII